MFRCTCSTRRERNYYDDHEEGCDLRKAPPVFVTTPGEPDGWARRMYEGFKVHRHPKRER